MRYLFGPTTPAFVSDHLQDACHAGSCVPFDASGTTGVAIRATDTWDAVLARLPEGWRPDFVALYLPYTSIPAGLWQAPVPLVGLAADWNLLWHQYRHQLRGCDLVLTDTVGVEALAREGITQARVANLFGVGRSYLEYPGAQQARDIDVLFVGNLHPAVQSERLPWLGRLARLRDRWRVEIHTGVFGDDYRALLARSRIVFNRSIRSEANQRVFETLAAGALLFQEAGNREVPLLLRDRQECVYYNDADLEALLDRYLGNEAERQRLADAGRRRAAEFGFARLWQQALDNTIALEWPQLLDRAGQRQVSRQASALAGRTWQVLNGGDDPALAADLAAELVGRPDDPHLHNALGLALARSATGVPSAEPAIGYFGRAVQRAPSHAVAGLNLVECLAATRQTEAAIDQARRTLAALEQDGPLTREVLDSGHFPPVFDHYRVAWEQAAWRNAGLPAAEERAKRDLLRWRLHFLLAELTGDLRNYYEAVIAGPDIPVSQAMLGCALARGGQAPLAVTHLRRAVAGDPFDASAARAFFQVLGDVGDAAGQARYARERRLLAKAVPRVVKEEPWFMNARPPGDELVSILILCHNQLDYTRQCLDSVLAHSRAPYELVIVDNGSTDGTSAFLEEIRGRGGPERVTVLRNETNRGFPAGCNQALAEARGQYVVFLNNDTVVTERWLDRLVTCVLADWPNVGMAGAVTNYSREPQQIPVDYSDLSGLAPFAARRRRDFAGQALAVERLTGFCLLARRDVLAKIGGLDEQFGTGFFEDDDLSVRVLQAGYRLLVALDVFIHHFGSRTFAGLQVDCAKQLQENFERFKNKWGTEHTAGYRVPDTMASSQPFSLAIPPVAYEGGSDELTDHVARAMAAAPIGTVPASPQRVSLCMIVKNEEHNLDDCLGPVAELVDEIVIVDTGSTDSTKDIATRHGAKVVDFPWVDSFAAARNESLRHATGDWVFWLDADDRVDEENRQRLQALFRSLTPYPAAYVMKCLCLPDPVHHTATVVDHVRLFRNLPAVRWQYRVHEQILPALRRQQVHVRWSDVTVQHVGYQDPALRGRKLERDLRLLDLENAEQPDDPFTLFNLGSVYQELGRPAEALPLLRRSLERSQSTDSIVRKLYALVAHCHRQLGQRREALAACAEGRRHYPEDAELLFQEAILRREQGDRLVAEELLTRLLIRREAAHFASVDTGLRGHKARHNLAVLYQEQGRTAEAEAQWRSATDEQPQFLPAWLGLGELYLQHQRWPELEGVVAQLANPAPVEAAVLRARGHLERSEYPAARQILEAAVERTPDALWPRRILTHVLLRDGRDPEAAEKALREFLVRVPDDGEARNNLEVLLRRLQPARMVGETE